MYDHGFMDNTNRQAVCKSQKKSVNKKCIFISILNILCNSTQLFVLVYTCLLRGWRVLFTVNVLSAKSRAIIVPEIYRQLFRAGHNVI